MKKIYTAGLAASALLFLYRASPNSSIDVNEITQVKSLEEKRAPSKAYNPFNSDGKYAREVSKIFTDEALNFHIPRQKSLIEILSDGLLAIDGKNTRYEHLRKHYEAVRDGKTQLAEYLRSFYGLNDEEVQANADHVKDYKSEYFKLMDRFLIDYRADAALDLLLRINRDGSLSDPNIATLLDSVHRNLQEDKSIHNPLGLASLKIKGNNTFDYFKPMIDDKIYGMVISDMQDISKSDLIQIGEMRNGIKFFQEKGNFNNLSGNSELNESILQQFDRFVYTFEHNDGPLNWSDYHLLGELWDLSPEVEIIRPGSLDHLIKLTVNVNSMWNKWNYSYLSSSGEETSKPPLVYLVEHFYPARTDLLRTLWPLALKELQKK